jgi:hypothetical protein
VSTGALVNGGFNIVSLLDVVAATKTGDALVARQEWRPRLRDLFGLPLAERQRNGHHVWDREVPPWNPPNKLNDSTSSWTLKFMDPTDAMVYTLESLPSFETELVIALKDWSWDTMMSVLNIPICMAGHFGVSRTHTLYPWVLLCRT